MRPTQRKYYDGYQDGITQLEEILTEAVEVARFYGIQAAAEAEHRGGPGSVPADCEVLVRRASAMLDGIQQGDTDPGNELRDLCHTIAHHAPEAAAEGLELMALVLARHYRTGVPVD